MLICYFFVKKIIFHNELPASLIVKATERVSFTDDKVFYTRDHQ